VFFAASALGLVFLVVSSSNASSMPSSGSSTTKRCLHLGQSIFRPIKFVSLIGTVASQRGHCCLKLVAAIVCLRHALGGRQAPTIGTLRDSPFYLNICGPELQRTNEKFRQAHPDQRSRHAVVRPIHANPIL